MSTPAGRSSFISASIVCGVELRDVDETLVHPDLELLARLLVHVRANEARCRRTAASGAGSDPTSARRSVGRAHDLTRRLVEVAWSYDLS